MLIKDKRLGREKSKKWVETSSKGIDEMQKLNTPASKEKSYGGKVIIDQITLAKQKNLDAMLGNRKASEKAKN